MDILTPEQIIHDKVNLGRILRRLEKSISTEEWKPGVRDDTWFKSKAILQRINFARKLLRNIESCESDSSVSVTQKFNDIRIRLDRVEMFMKDVEKRLAPEDKPPISMLACTPTPEVTEIQIDEPPIHGDVTQPTDDLLLSPMDKTAPPSAFTSPIPSLLPSTTVTTESTAAIATGVSSKFLQNSNALHQELSDQLAQMATQLKRNALHFSESLSRDKAVVEEAQQKLEGNHDVMQKERVRLRDHRGKSGSTTYLVVLSVIAVIVVFILMFFVIHFT